MTKTIDLRLVNKDGNMPWVLLLRRTLIASMLLYNAILRNCSCRSVVIPWLLELRLSNGEVCKPSDTIWKVELKPADMA